LSGKCGMPFIKMYCYSVVDYLLSDNIYIFVTFVLFTGETITLYPIGHQLQERQLLISAGNPLS